MPPFDTLTDVQHSRLVLNAGDAPVNPLANNPRRNYLYIRNNGANPGNFWFDQSSDSGQSITLAPQASWEPIAGGKVPINRVFFQSAGGTVFAIIEGVEPSSFTAPGAADTTRGARG